ncbi:MAG TPA: hypothetical protein VHO69_11760 [Phototrophicaceae bacterium]|nr:hypothetical protein [Phototrophicaceae bacterium]
MSARQPKSDSERERAQRILDQQIRARDPGVSKIKGYDWSKHAKRSQQVQQARQKPLLVELFDVLPRRWKGAAVGLLLSLIPLIAALIFIAPPWQILGLLPPLLFGVVGYVLGKVTEDDLKKW